MSSDFILHVGESNGDEHDITKPRQWSQSLLVVICLNGKLALQV